MKTPDEIKKGLEIVRNGCMTCDCCITDCPYDPECFPTVDMPKQMAEDALAYIQQLEMRHGKDINVPRWISVEERLPEDVITSWLIYANSDIETACWTHDKYGLAWWFFVDGEYAIGVTHWMPLPEPPKEE